MLTKFLVCVTLGLCGVGLLMPVVMSIQWMKTGRAYLRGWVDKSDRPVEYALSLAIVWALCAPFGIISVALSVLLSLGTLPVDWPS